MTLDEPSAPPLEEVLELVPDPVLLRRRDDGVVVAANGGFAEIVSRPLDEVVGSRLDDLDLAFDEEGRREYRERLEEEGVVRNFELQVRHPGEAEPRTHLVSSKLVEHGGTPCVLTVGKDITERHEVGERLRRSEQRYRDLFERNVAGTFRTSLEGEILECNPAFAEMLGYEGPEDLVGRNAAELYASPEDREEWMEQLQEERDLAGVELELVRPDGAPVWVLENSFLTEDPETGEPVNMGTLVDISERKRAEQELRRSERRYRQLFEESLVGIAVVGADGQPLTVNEPLTEILGYSASELTGMTFEELTHPEDVEQDVRLYRELMAEERESYRLEKRYLSAQGETVWADLYVTRVPALGDSEDGQRAVAFVRDKTEEKEYEEQLRYQAYHDSLTGLANRRLLEIQAERAINEADRSGERVALLFVDLHRFKRINDSFGHQTGDRVLGQVAQRLLGCTRGADVCARVGGDEFALLVTDLGEPEGARDLAARLDRAFEKPLRADEERVHLQAKIGIAVYPDHASNFSQLLSLADQAMYQSDPAAAETVSFYHPPKDLPSADEVSREAALRRALEEGELRLHYQPIYPVSGDGVMGAEGLVRWARSESVLLRAAQFVPLAERTGLAWDLDQGVLGLAVEQLAAWEGREETPDWISVNLSAAALNRPELIGYVRRLLEEHGVAGRRLVVEVTERVAMRDPEVVAGTLQELEELGVGVAIDDYGTGHAVLAYLKHFEAQFLKLDMVFVQRLGDDPRDEDLVHGVVTLGHELDLQVIAEGVETEEQMSVLARIDTDLAQGYYLGEPVAAAELL